MAWIASLPLAALAVGLLLLQPAPAAAAAAGPTTTKQRKQPNILLIVADDQGHAQVGYHNATTLTPRIDALAAAGVTLENYCECATDFSLSFSGWPRGAPSAPPSHEPHHGDHAVNLARCP